MGSATPRSGRSANANEPIPVATCFLAAAAAGDVHIVQGPRSHPARGAGYAQSWSLCHVPGRVPKRLVAANRTGRRGECTAVRRAHPGTRFRRLVSRRAGGAGSCPLNVERNSLIDADRVIGIQQRWARVPCVVATRPPHGRVSLRRVVVGRGSVLLVAISGRSSPATPCGLLASLGTHESVRTGEEIAERIDGDA